MISQAPQADRKKGSQNRLREPPRAPLESSWGTCREGQAAQGAAQDASRRQQEPPRAPQERPRAAQIQLLSGLGGYMGPTWRPRALPKAPGGHLGPPTERFSAHRGALCAHFPNLRKACSKLSCGQSLCKHTASIARRPCVTSTCGLVRRRTPG